MRYPPYLRSSKRQRSTKAAGARISIAIVHIEAGIMLPNHPPLVIAEQFGTLERLFTGRTDLGLGFAHSSSLPVPEEQSAARASRDGDP